MKWYAEMRVRGSGALDDARFDALADALADIEEADPAVEDADLTASLADGWVVASMTIGADRVESVVPKLIATVRAAIHKIGDGTPAWGWEAFAARASIAVKPAEDREPVTA